VIAPSTYLTCGDDTTRDGCYPVTSAPTRWARTDVDRILGSMRRSVLHMVAAAFLAALLAPTAALAAPARPPLSPVSYSVTATDSLTTNAIDLLISFNAAQAELSSLDAKIAIVATQTAEQSATLDAAVRTYDTAQKVYNERAVEMYQAGDYDLISILLDADSFADLVARLEVVSRILEADRYALEELEIVADQARFQSARLDALTAELTALRSARTQRATTATTAQTSLATLEPQLTFEGDTALDSVRSADSAYRAKWVAASVPGTVTVRTRTARVLPYPEKYLSSRYHYARYRTTDMVFQAVATSYGTRFNGCVTASGQILNTTDFTCAHSSLPIGTWLAVSRTDPATAVVNRIIVVVNDRGPYIANRDMALSRAAADALGLSGSTVGTVQCEIVKPLP